MGEQEEGSNVDLASIELETDFKEDFYEDYRLDTDWNVHHLSISKVALQFFSRHDILWDFKPLVDQLSATNHLDWNEREYYKYMVDGLVLDLYTQGHGDNSREAKIINIARQYMHNIIDGCKGGYRGKLVTEARKVYRTESSIETPPKRGLFR